MTKPKGLGRGLEALLGGDDEASSRGALLTLPVSRIRPGKYQPRTKRAQEALAELAASIRSQGLMQPLLVRPVDRDRYELIAGEGGPGAPPGGGGAGGSRPRGGGG